MKRYYLSAITGKGSRVDPFRPAAADHARGYDWGMIDLREDVSAVTGPAIIFADTPSPIAAAGIEPLGSDLKVPLTAASRQALVTALGIALNENSLPEMLAELLSVKRPGLCQPLQPMSDGKSRIFLGEQIWGEPLPVSGSGTIHDNFNRANADALGTSSEGWSWVERVGDTDILSNQAYSTTNPGMAESYANTADPTSDDHYVQAKVTAPGGSQFDGGIAARMSTSAETYYAFYSVQEGSCWNLFKFVSGSYTLIASYSTGWALPNGNVLRLEVDGSSLTGKQDGATKIATTDTSITGNTRAGLSSYKPCYWDDFEASDLQTVTPKTAADTGGGTDAKDASQPLAQSLKEDTGSGGDALAGYPVAAITRDETGGGVESIFARTLAGFESGNGLDSSTDYPGVAVGDEDAATGIESLLGRWLAGSEAGEGVDEMETGHPAAELPASDSGEGLDAIIALVQSFTIVSDDSGLGIDVLETSLALVTFSDTGLGADAPLSRDIEGAETGSGREAGSLLASILDTGDTGLAVESSEYLPLITPGDAGLGAELIFLLKDIEGGDWGKGEDTFKSLVGTAKSGPETRLFRRAGQADVDGKDKKSSRRHGQSNIPSRRVNK